MGPQETWQIRLPVGFKADQLEGLLVADFPFTRGDPLQVLLSFYDTFDWRIYRKSLTLHSQGDELVLRRLPEGEALERAAGSLPATFTRDMPASGLKEQLAPLTEPRALLELASISLKSWIYRILNADEKTVARLVFTKASAPANESGLPTDAYLELRPVRGYARYARQLRERLAGLGEQVDLWYEVYATAMRSSGREPGDYSSKLDLQLEPDMRADDATRRILRRLLAVMKANEDGIHADIDVEFLHDYRVAVRRTRSALSQIKNVFPAEAVGHFKGEFAELGRLSNELRDLDVYLLSERSYREMLAPVLREDIAPMFAYLRSQRPEALARVSAHLDSRAYARFISNWEAFLNEPSPGETPAMNAGVPVIDLACKRIYKHYRKVIKDGDDLLERPSDEGMHALRIECKKLRYLIEFFASLFPPDDVEALVSQLKRLQDNLGEFNDLSVQELYLLDVSGKLPLGEAGSRRTLVAIGALIQSLAQRQDSVRSEFAHTFRQFSSPENQAQYRRLFAKKV